LQRVLTTVTLLGLLVATSAAFAITEHLKLEKSALYAVQVSAGSTPDVRRGLPVVISPVCNCSTSVARVGFELRQPERVTVTIVDSDGNTVATRINDKLLAGHSSQHIVWDGRTDSGGVVRDGVYYPSITLGRRTFQLANKITVDTKPPQVLHATGLKPVLLAGPGRSVAIKYVLDEKAHALVYLGNGRRPIVVGRHTRLTDKIKWNGKLHHRPLPPGTYVLSIGAQDLAGNKTPVRGRQQIAVQLQYIVLSPGRISIRSGRSFDVHVETASRHYTWRLGQRHGERHRKTLRLRAPSTPGTYRLVVAQNGHTATAVVRVHK
jgi:FlgD Ig-like domain